MDSPNPEEEYLTEKELLQFAAAWESDRVSPMEPLVEEYGWDGLVKRVENSILGEPPW
jgi:hypothetical protein